MGGQYSGQQLCPRYCSNSEVMPLNGLHILHFVTLQVTATYFCDVHLVSLGWEAR